MKIVVRELSQRMNIGETGWAENHWILCNNAVPNYILLPDDINVSDRQVISRDYHRMNLRKLKRQHYVAIPSFIEEKYSELTLKNSKDLVENNIKLINRITRYFYGDNGYGFECHNITKSEYQLLYSHPENDYLPMDNKEYWLIDETSRELYIGKNGNIMKAEENVEVKAVMLPIFEVPGGCIIDTEKKVLITPEDVEELKKL